MFRYDLGKSAIFLEKIVTRPVIFISKSESLMFFDPKTVVNFEKNGGLPLGICGPFSGKPPILPVFGLWHIGDHRKVPKTTFFELPTKNWP